MKVSVVIVTYNRKKLAQKLSHQIRSLEPHTDLIVIDQTHQEPNLCRGRNEGYQKAKGDIVIYFDDDVEITKDTIKAHVHEYQDPNIVGVAGRVINDGEVTPEQTKVVVGKANTLLTKFDKNFWGTKRQTVQFPYGCNMSFRKKILVDTGGFDENIPSPATAFDEIDLALRIKNGTIIFSPKALVFHHRALTGGTRENNSLRKKQYYQSYGRLIRKHVSFPLSLISAFILKMRIIKEAPETLFSFLKGYFLYEN